MVTHPCLRIPNLVLALLRELREYSQQDLADRLTEEAVRQGDNQTICDARMIRRWENGEVVWPQDKYRVLLERVFDKPASELGFVRRWTRTPLGWTLVSATTRPQIKDETDNPVFKEEFPDLLCDFDDLPGEREEETWLLSEVARSATANDRGESECDTSSRPSAWPSGSILSTTARAGALFYAKPSTA